MGKRQIQSDNHLQHVFDMELQYSTEAVECAPIAIAEGKIIGSGDGVISGSGIQGKVKWSNYENTVRDGVCKLQIPGSIRTNENEEIAFEARGIAINPDKLMPSNWDVAGVFYFDTSSKKYDWLNNALVIYEGQFDMNTAHASYHAYTKTSPEEST